MWSRCGIKITANYSQVLGHQKVSLGPFEKGAGELVALELLCVGLRCAGKALEVQSPQGKQRQ